MKIPYTNEHLIYDLLGPLVPNIAWFILISSWSYLIFKTIGKKVLYYFAKYSENSIKIFFKNIYLLLFIAFLLIYGNRLYKVNKIIENISKFYIYLPLYLSEAYYCKLFLFNETCKLCEQNNSILVLFTYIKQWVTINPFFLRRKAALELNVYIWLSVILPVLNGKHLIWFT